MGLRVGMFFFFDFDGEPDNQPKPKKLNRKKLYSVRRRAKKERKEAAEATEAGEGGEVVGDVFSLISMARTPLGRL